MHTVIKHTVRMYHFLASVDSLAFKGSFYLNDEIKTSGLQRKKLKPIGDTEKKDR